MKYFTFFLAALALNISQAETISPVNQGQSISAAKVNELISKVNELSSEVVYLKKQALPVGTIVQSLLTPTQYVSENGDCWRLANGSFLASTDELKSIYGFSSVPDALSSGAFLRQAKNGRVLGSYQADEIKSHNHAIVSPADITFRGGSGGSGFAAGGTYQGPNHAPTIGYTGGEETRPKNLAVNMFIKFKKQCNY